MADRRPSDIRLRGGTPGAVDARRTRLGDHDVILARCDPSVRKGALTPEDGETLADAARHALASRLPLIVSMASSGADVGAGLAATFGWGRAARAITECSGVVPILMVAAGPAVSGPALLLGLADHVVMTTDAYAFVSGPRMVMEITGVAVDPDELGGTAVHAALTGLAALVAADADEALDAITDLLDYLPAHVDERPPIRPTSDPADRATPELRDLVPAASHGSYDVRDAIRSIADDGEMIELRASWAGNLVTAFASVDGRPAGFLANQPQTIAGTLDIAASQKGARFVAFCDAFNLPLVTLIDTSGFYPGKDLEWRGIIRHGAQMAFAYARATVPRIAIVLRKAYGGAYIVMDSRPMGSDLYLAWPSAEVAVMGAKGAVEILHRRATPDERAEAELAYEDAFLNPWRASERGSVDAVIDPADTRREIANALETLDSKQERLAGRRHDNTPL
ncbi:MAG TPA: carboxyl transferase domain-containing protein [Acidimicrobiales bacterium]|jgi:acetyl-CoA carboxylase carboxyltransferase component